MTYQQILKDLKNKVYHPIYLLCGEEEYFIDLISDYVEEHVLEDAEKEFNQSILYGMDTNVLNLISEAKRYPMMANYNVVIVKEAQNLKINKDEEVALESYAKNPSSTTILVLCFKHKKPDGRKGSTKAIKKHGIWFESKRLYDNQIIPWLEGYISNLGFKIEPKAAVLMVEFLGTELSTISNEVKKMIINLEAGTLITSKIIEENIGLSKDYNVFELNKALGERNLVRSYQIANHFSKNEKGHPLQMTIPAIYRFFSQLLLFLSLRNMPPNQVASKMGINPYFLKDYQKASNNYNQKKIARIISALKNADLQAKGVISSSMTSEDILKELIFKILH